MMNQSSADEKWSCEKCTYFNWPSSQKCTICRSSKPLHVLFGGNMGPKSQDIYQLAPPPIVADDENQHNGSSAGPTTTTTNSNLLIENSTSMVDVSGTGGIIGVGNFPSNQSVKKWACNACTYLNWPRSLKCVQCQTVRSKDKQSRGSQKLCKIEQNEPKTETNSRSGSARNSPPPSTTPSSFVGVSLSSQSPPPTTTSFEKSQSLSSGPNLSDAKSPSSPDSNVEGPSTILDSRIIAKKLQKWTCVGCTYENWPKTVKCVMCYTPKPGSSPTGRRVRTTQSPSSPNASVDATGSGSDSNDKKRSLSSGKDGGRKSPKSSSSTESVNSDSISTTNNAAATVGMATASTSLSSSTVLSCHATQTSSSSAGGGGENKFEKHMKKLRKQLRDVDYLWLNAVRSVVVGCGSMDCDPIEAFMAAGGDVARALSHAEAQLLSCSFIGSHFETGHTLVHLAIKHQREDLLNFLLACTDQPIGGRRVKKVPCHLSPDAAADIRRQVAMSLRQRKGDMSCFFFTDLMTFCLPSAIYDLPPTIQEKLFDELLDRNVQKELEEEYSIVNWSVEVTDRLGSRLFALWNRTAGDCLLDSVLQATWGVFDSENSLRQALADSLSDAANMFYPRWREYETWLADLLHFTIDEEQFARDWDLILQLASKPGSALEQAHIFALAHLIRRPIIVYGVRIVKSFRGESIDYARFEGLYLPLLWEPSFCWRSPICLGYTRGHFSALVPMEPEAFEYAAIARVREFPQQPRHIYLPLQDADGQMLPIHFLSNAERGHEQILLKNWLDVCVTDGGLLCCKMRLHRLPPLVQQMVEDWLDYYRRLGQMHQAASTALARSKVGIGSSSMKKSQQSTTAAAPIVAAQLSSSGTLQTNTAPLIIPNVPPPSSSSSSSDSNKNKKLYIESLTSGDSEDDS